MPFDPTDIKTNLFFILAREAPLGIIFRRGPRKWVQLIKWNTADDTFEEGQWFHGRIYEKRCDLSPDGTKLIYFAQKINHRQMSSEEGYATTWTALSNVPYLTALALWPNDGETFGGGGLFIDNGHVKLNVNTAAHPAHRPNRRKVVVEKAPFVVGDDAIYHRLPSYGWQGGRRARTLHKKPHPQQPFLLIMKTQTSRTLGGSLEIRHYIIHHKTEGTDIPVGEADWADWDHQGRLVFTREGKVFAAKLAEDGSFSPSEIADFSQNKPQPAESLPWARVW